jgi:predicted nuclease of predicted toxin-antitoxin system
MRFLLDENFEHDVLYRLRNEGHDVVHVDLSDRLEKGAPDADLATFSRDRQFVIVTYDDDFRDEFTDDGYHAVLYFADQTLSSRTIAGVLDEIATYLGESDLQGFMPVGRSWV